MTRHFRGLLAVTCMIGLTASTYAADPLAKRLISSDPRVRQRAIAQFNRLPNATQQELIPDLMMASTSEDEGVRTDTQALLSKLGVSARANADDMQKQASEEEKSPFGSPVRQNSLEELKAAKEKEFNSMREELEHEKKAQYGSMPKASDAHSSLVEALQDSDPLIRSHAARQLGKLHPAPTEAIPGLIGLLKASDAESRGAAAAALGEMGPLAHDAVPALIQCLADPNPTVRQIVGDALKQIRGS